MKRLLATAGIFAAVGALLAAPHADQPKPPQAGKFLFEAVSVGLAEDGVAPELAQELAKRDGDFVPKCDICGMTRKALYYHAGLEKPTAAKDGKGLPEELVKRLKSDTDATRRLALRELVQRYTERAYARAELTADQRAAMQKELEVMRKQAMPGLREGQKFCPSCDGACRLTPKL
jgi:hypothetical protein